MTMQILYSRYLGMQYDLYLVLRLLNWDYLRWSQYSYPWQA